MQLSSPINSLGPFVRRYGRELAALGIKTVGDALAHYPFRYEDLSCIVKIAEARPGETTTVRGTLKSIGSFRTPRRKIFIVEALLSDGSGNVLLTWFGQRHLIKVLKPGDELLVSGTPELGKRGIQFISPVWEPARDVQAHVGRIVPVYSVTGGLTPKAMRAIMLQLLPAADLLQEILPADIVARHALPQRNEMARALHFPESAETLRAAERRRDFEQLFLISLGNAWLRADLARYSATPIPFDQETTKNFVSRLPFSLTDGQKKSAWQILKDMSASRPMNRLLDGDVGSGKTLVAAIAALNAARAGAQSVFLVPTGVLALQHFETLSRYLSEVKINIALLTASTARESQAGRVADVGRAKLLEEIQSGAVSLVVGTHALLEEKVSFAQLALTVVDEQHRFGVAQRKALGEKAGAGRLPHLLSMTATPIPRTLSLTAFGDLDLSVIPERPPGRLPVKTTVVSRDKKTVLTAALNQTVKDGHQAFVVCPRIAEEGASSRRSVELVAKELKTMVPKLRLATLHGKMKAEKKDELMSAFVAGKHDILISTTVIEVGVDVPNATLMVVEGAEHFGLAQLHQLRGRVGRGSAPGVCLLIPDQASPDSYRRLKLLECCYDGWRLAEADLRERGPGEILGTAQTGFSELSAAALQNTALRETANEEARRLLAADPALTRSPALAALLTVRFGKVQLS
ncbi:ATP-dependent DNA helicase RecG [Patescibacteria group bacterium]|nr:MAG: ATP-dependent DNA helicase RecG [Patescibacteria group bacterium]